MSWPLLIRTRTDHEWISNVFYAMLKMQLYLFFYTHHTSHRWSGSLSSGGGQLETRRTGVVVVVVVVNSILVAGRMLSRIDRWWAKFS
jgi:hypothetical protein